MYKSIIFTLTLCTFSFIQAGAGSIAPADSSEGHLKQCPKSSKQYKCNQTGSDGLTCDKHNRYFSRAHLDKNSSDKQKVESICGPQSVGATEQEYE